MKSNVYSGDRLPQRNDNESQLARDESMSFIASESDNEPFFTSDILQRDITDRSEAAPMPSYSPRQEEDVRRGFRAAIESGNESLAQHLTSEYPDLSLPATTRFEHGASNCLHIAIANRSYRLIGFLLEQGVSPNQQNSKTGDTALHYAANARDEHIMAMLLQYDGDVEITNHAFQTVRDIEAEYGGIALFTPQTIDGVEADAQTVDRSLHSIANSIALDVLSSVEESVSKDTDSDPEDIGMATLEIFSTSETIRVARENPFSKLKRQNTANAIEKLSSLSHGGQGLPSLEGWLDLKKATAPWSWQKRWVVVAGSHILWSDKQQDPKERRTKSLPSRTRMTLSLMNLRQIRAIEKGKTRKKFAFADQNGNEFLWKCARTEDRNFWVGGLQKHIKHHQMLIDVLGTK